jgi:putative thioredoxin
VMAFRDGKPASSFSGALPETNVRKYFREWIPGPEEAAVAEATGFITSRHWPEAEASARRALQTTPGNSKAALLLLKAILAQGKGSLALDLLADFPSGNEVIAADRLRPLADWLAEAEASGDTGADESESGYLQAARLLAKGNILAALDGLLEVLRRDKHYRQDEARKVFIAILEILGDEDPLTRQYRDELASILF